MADARRGLARLLERARTEYVPPGAVAAVYAKLGDTINQDIWLMRAYEEHSNAMAYLLVDTARVWHTDATVVKLIAAMKYVPSLDIGFVALSNADVRRRCHRASRSVVERRRGSARSADAARIRRVPADRHAADAW